MGPSDNSAPAKGVPLVLSEKNGVLYDADSRPSSPGPGSPGLGPRDAYDIDCYR
ncbi:hypothetical protein FIBSPDRAFT_957153 [Athelia psychrophila]|uniref:Uncharacterized protein n=1 Tax=Athelia psychrophila TaxID=1759441 RepID=A0A166G792_9AGAM|nr:hypothetical protein FIBSPDRAFT_957153 [Fibularhizoctonia sp. CBS 109695]